jgi:hypothetical protein
MQAVRKRAKAGLASSSSCLVHPSYPAISAQLVCVDPTAWNDGCSNRRVDQVTAVGSTRTSWALMATSNKSYKAQYVAKGFYHQYTPPPSTSPPCSHAARLAAQTTEPRHTHTCPFPSPQTVTFGVRDQRPIPFTPLVDVARESSVTLKTCWPPTPALLPIIAISLLGIVGIVGYLARHELD